MSLRDALGSMYACARARHDEAAARLGSHLDTQPTAASTTASSHAGGAEVVRTLNDPALETETPLCVIN